MDFNRLDAIVKTSNRRIKDVHEREELIRVTRDCLSQLNDLYQECHGKVFNYYKGYPEPITYILTPISKAVCYIINEFFIKYDFKKEDNENILYRKLNLGSFTIKYYSMDNYFSQTDPNPEDINSDALCSLDFFLEICANFFYNNRESHSSKK